MIAVPDEALARLTRLKGYLSSDPDNAHLRADAVEAALAAGDLPQSKSLLATRSDGSPPPPRLLNLKGLIALQEGRYSEAIGIFSQLDMGTPETSAFRLNLAWAKAMSGDRLGALSLLQDGLGEESASGATLQVQTLHGLGRLDAALSFGGSVSMKFVDAPALLGALAVVAMDAGDAPLAETYAQRGGQDPDALGVKGMFALDVGDTEAASKDFDKALATAPQNARALLGKGLTLMVERRALAAATYIDQAAALFDDHLGSWVASGWAHFAAGDLVASRTSFERALTLDDRFAEAQGGLAVVELSLGDKASAERRSEVALRLDRRCLSAALAKIILLKAEGKETAAERARNAAFNHPLDAKGRTLAQALVQFANAPRKP